MKTRFSLLFLICNLSVYSYSQIARVDNNRELVDRNIEKYMEYTKDYAVIFCGLDQPKLIKNIKSAYLRMKGNKEYDTWGRASFDVSSKTNGLFDEGVLLYDGIKYSKMPMRLDIYRNELVILTPNMIYSVLLDPARLEYADFNGYRVVYRDKNSEVNLPEGYYMQLYADKSVVLMRETISLNRERDEFFDWSKKYYILKDGIYYNVKNKKNVLNLYKSHKKELERYIKDMKINFDDMELAIPLVVEQYDKLIEKQ